MRRRHQGGRLFKRGKTLKWVFQFWEDRLQPTYKRVRRTVTLGLVSTMSRRQALAATQPYIDRVNTAPAPTVGRGGKTFSEMAQEWRDHNASNPKPSAIRAAESHLRRHILPRLGSLPLRDLTLKTLQAFVNSVAATGIRRKTQENILNTVFSILKLARKFGYSLPEVDRSDLRLSDNEDPTEARSLTAEQIRQIINHAKEPFATMFTVLGITAVRAGELLGLKIDDLDFDRKVIHIRRSLDDRTRKEQSTKTRGSTAEIHMPVRLEKRLCDFLKTGHRENPNRYLFVNRNLSPYFQNKVIKFGLRPVLKKLGIPPCGLHAFRHGAASELLGRGALLTVVQKQLRHRDVKTTMRYIHAPQDSQCRAVDLLAENIVQLESAV
jgi:integrase